MLIVEFHCIALSFLIMAGLVIRILSQGWTVWQESDPSPLVALTRLYECGNYYNSKLLLQT